MGLSLRWVVVDCVDTQSLAEFWAAVLGREIAEGGESWASMPGEPHLFFVQVPEGKTAKNRWHLDWDAADRAAEVERLIELGATRVGDRREVDLGLEWTSMTDPEGNEFCVVQAVAP